MGNVTDKITYLQGTKNAIRQAIENKGVAVADNDTFRSYAEKIDGIVTGGGELPEESLKITGNCSYRFAFNGWNWFVDEYGNQVTTENIDNLGYMFRNSTTLKEIPFDINTIDYISSSTSYVFAGCTALEKIANIRANIYAGTTFWFQDCKNLKEIGDIKDLHSSQMNSFFSGCNRLRTVPNFVNLDLGSLTTNASGTCTYMFQYCYSLRSIPEEFISKFKGIWTSGSYSIYNSLAYFATSLDELTGLPVSTGKMTSNGFINTVVNASRLKRFVFSTQEDGTPYTATWKSQIIDLALSGFSSGTYSYIVDYNSGITADKEVTDDATYQALKNDPDWFTQEPKYSRYNHSSAVETINSLPDTSAYLATAGGTNTIKFRGDAGSATDGGAINTLTEEEIAVATAKGWTVTLV